MVSVAQAHPQDAHPDAIPGVPLYTDGGDGTSRFVTHGYQDVWAAVVFVLAASAVAIGSIAAAGTHPPMDVATASPASVTSTPHADVPLSLVFTAALGYVACITGAVVAVLALLTSFPKQVMIAANVITGALMLLYGILLLANGAYEGIVLTAIGVGLWVWMYIARDRIPFSAMLLRQCATLLKRFPSIYFAIAGVVLMALVHSLLSLMAIAMFAMYGKTTNAEGREELSGGATTGIVLVVFVMFWTSQVASGVLHTTSAGVSATWYFCSGAMPSNPTLKSFKRATTTSFGSVCFGSLLVALVRLMRFLIQRLIRSNHEIVACIARCLLACIEGLVQLFNDYALSYVAIYGLGYIESARRTWELTKSCGATVLFTDELVSNTVQLLSLLSSALIALVWGVLYHSVMVGVVVFVVTMIVMLVSMQPIRSYMTALLVCYAEAPTPLQRLSPEMYDKLATSQHEV